MNRDLLVKDKTNDTVELDLESGETKPIPICAAVGVLLSNVVLYTINVRICHRTPEAVVKAKDKLSHAELFLITKHSTPLSALGDIVLERDKYGFIFVTKCGEFVIDSLIVNKFLYELLGLDTTPSNTAIYTF